MTVQQDAATTKPPLAAAIFIWSLQLLASGELWPGSVQEILALTGAHRTQAYEILARLKSASTALEGRPGRPPEHDALADDRLAVLMQVRDFLIDNPGAVCGQASRRSYSDGFRQLVVGLAAPDQAGHRMTVEALATTTGVPMGTLKDWLRTPAPAEQPSAPEPGPESTQPQELAANPQMATILAEWPSWDGTFVAFCDYVRREHRLPYGTTFIGNVLAAAGLRDRPPRRQQDTPWSPGTFRTFFPGAQWLGDGTTIGIWLAGRIFAFNVEVILDTTSNAMLGVTVTDTEDEQAVLETFAQSTLTAGDGPVALTLDNRPSNHTDGVRDGVAPAALLPATPGRGQAKAALEGTFGLFQQTAPPLVIRGETQREMARSCLSLIFTIWGWARNGKPRAKLGGRSPQDEYRQDRPTDAELQAAMARLAEIQRRAERARLTRAAQADPLRKAILTQGLADLGIADDDLRIASALARYNFDAIMRGLATFQAKQEQDTLPPDVLPDRYLGGIIRNLDQRYELERTAHHLLEQRLRARDFSLAALQQAARDVRRTTPEEDLPQALLDRALTADRLVDSRFWAATAMAEFERFSPKSRAELYPTLAKRIAATFKVPADRRSDLIDQLARATVHLA